MINILAWLFGIVVACFVLLIAGENIAENVPPENWFRKWWRNNIIGEDVYDDDF